MSASTETARFGSSAAVRRHLVEALRADLIGPFFPDDPAAPEVWDMAPSKRYLYGFLVPPGEGRAIIFMSSGHRKLNQASSYRQKQAEILWRMRMFACRNQEEITCKSMEHSQVIVAVEKHISDLLSTRIDERYVYHNLKHTLAVRDACLLLANKSGIPDEDREVLELAALLHDTGFIEQYNGHEDVSCRIAADLLSQHNYPAEKSEKVLACIATTKLSSQPETLLEMLMRDADLAHLAPMIISFR